MRFARHAWLPGLAALLLLAACDPGQVGSCQLARAAVIPFTVQSHHVAISPLLNGEPTDMMVDTGAQLTTLTTLAARRLSLRLEPLPGHIEGIGGTSQAYGFVARTLQIGRLHGRNFQLAAANMGPAGRGDFGDGLFGADFLAAYDVDIDVPGRDVILYKTTGLCAKPIAALDGDLYVVPLLAGFTSNDARPHIRVQIGGKTLVALVDTGAPYSVLFRDPARRIGLDTASLSTDRHLRAGGVGPGTRDAVRHVLTPVTIGDLTVSHLPVAIIDEGAPQDADMLLGMDFMSRVHTWFSFSSHNLVLQYPLRPSPQVQAGR